MIQSNPKISVIMAAHNVDKYISEAITSIINQTFQDWELIIINDASTDQTYKIAERYKKCDKRIKIINMRKNQGPAIARNNGLKIAKGNYIAILDADDLAYPERFEIQYNYLEKNKDIFFVTSSFQFIDGKGGLIAEEKYLDTININPGQIYVNYIPHHSSVMARARPKWHYRKNLLSEDSDLMQRLMEKNLKLQILPEVLSKYRIHKESISVKNKGDLEFFELKVMSYKLQRIISGQDSYKNINNLSNLKDKKSYQDVWTVEEILNSRRKFIELRRKFINLADREILSQTYESQRMRQFRKLVLKAVKNDGLALWKKEIFYYFASFLPKELKERIKSSQIWIFTYRSNSLLKELPKRLASKIKPVIKKVNNKLKYGSKDLFVQVDIDTNTACNRKCKYCPNSLYSRGLIRNKELMPPQQYYKIIEELAELKFKGVICPSFYGEPLLDNRLLNLIKYTKSRLPDSHIKIFTNGDFLNLKYYARLCQAGVNEFVITQHGPKPNREVEKIKTYAKRHLEEGVNVAYEKLSQIHNRGGLIKSGSPLQDAQCRLLDPTLTIDHNGNVILCCQDYLSSVKFGNIKNEKLLDIWNKPVYKHLRENIRKGKFDLEICKKCLGKI